MIIDNIEDCIEIFNCNLGVLYSKTPKYADKRIHKIKNQYGNRVKKCKFKYKLNLLNCFYSYTYSYLSRFVYEYLYTTQYMKHNFITKNNNFTTLVLYYNKIFIKKKQKKSMKYDLIIGSGSNTSWVGVGSSKNSIYRNACDQASIKSTQYIYNLNFKTNDYKVFKYKNYKFSMLNKSTNKYNLSIYNNIALLAGVKKYKLISHTSSKTKILLGAILHYSS
uniref:Ribosomal protein S5 n=1 Tax=Babesia motasi TaxID=237580 RepID=A0A411ADG8_9APIC|nr:ribosomal protein S5 [Babesia motasi]